MSRYVLKRLGQLILVLLGVSFIIFAIMSMAKGDPGRMILGESASQAAVDKMNEELGINKPFLERYGNFLYDAVFHLDFGDSYRTGKPVIDEVFARVGNSMKIAFCGIAGAVVIGVPLGVLSAVKQYSWLDNISRVLAMMSASIPAFWMALMLINFFALKMRLLPSNGAETPLHFVLPTITLAIPYAGSLLRMTRSAMLETIRAEYVRTAKAKGVPQKVIIFGHALKNALLPIITVTATSFGGLLGGAVITENVYSIPGLGTLIVTGIKQRDTPVVLGATIFLAFIFGIIMLAVDLLFAFVDPRIKAKYSK